MAEAEVFEKTSEKVEKSEKSEKKKNGNEKPAFDLHNPSFEVEQARLKSIVRHITHVQQSCTLLGERLISSGEERIGHKLIAHGFIHDNSKFYGIEWKYLHDDVKANAPEMFQMALTQHVTRNMHHPEYWDGIDNMPRVYLAEMVCDWHARGSEFGTDLRNFIKNHAAKKFDFTLKGRVYKEIKSLVDLLLDQSFV